MQQLEASAEPVSSANPSRPRPQKRNKSQRYSDGNFPLHEIDPTLSAFYSLCRSYGPTRNFAGLMGLSRDWVDDLVSGRKPITAKRALRVAELAREKAQEFMQLARIMEYEEAPAWRKRREEWKRKARKRFYDRFGHWPEAEQVVARREANRQKPLTGGRPPSAG